MFFGPQIGLQSQFFALVFFAPDFHVIVWSLDGMDEEQIENILRKNPFRHFKLQNILLHFQRNQESVSNVVANIQ